MQTEIFSFNLNLGLIIGIFELFIYFIIKNTPRIGEVYGGGITGWIGLLTGAIIIKPSIEVLSIVALFVLIVILIIYMLAGRPDLRGNILDNLPHLGKALAFIVPILLAVV